VDGAGHEVAELVHPKRGVVRHDGLGAPPPISTPQHPADEVLVWRSGEVRETEDPPVHSKCSPCPVAARRGEAQRFGGFGAGRTWRV
jgi:hypothetical protein